MVSPAQAVIQIDARPEHIGRRTHVDLGLVGHCDPTLTALLDRVTPKTDDTHLATSRPFVGPAGWILDQALDLAGIDREAAYVTTWSSTSGGRPPTTGRAGST